MTEGVDPILRAHDWKRIWEEDGGLKSAFDHIRMSYFKRAGLVEPWEGEKLGKLALASRILDMVEDHAKAVIAAGTLAEHGDAKAQQIAAVPEHKRRWLNI